MLYAIDAAVHIQVILNLQLKTNRYQRNGISASTLKSGHSKDITTTSLKGITLGLKIDQTGRRTNGTFGNRRIRI